VRAIVARYPEGATVSDADDDALLRDLVDMHRDPGRKVGPGIECFVIRHVPGSKNLSFYIKQVGVEELVDFGWKKTIDGEPSLRAQVTQALVNAGRPITEAFRREAFERGPVRIGGRTFTRESEVEVRHVHPPLRDLAAEFVSANGGWAAIALVDASGPYPGKEPASEEICDAWRAWQASHVSGLGLAPAAY
jgi:hypothetical protein